MMCYDLYANNMLDFEDDICLLKLNQEYDRKVQHKPGFLYDYTDERLQMLRALCGLDSLAGNGSEFTRMLRITFGISSILELGESTNIGPFHAIDILNRTKQGFKSNCFVAATVLSECFLSMGYVARVVRCMPIDLRFNECHCMTIVFVKSLNKFVAFDAAMGGCYINSQGVPLGISDMRKMIIEGETFYIRSIFKMQNRNIIAYLCKNMIRFQSHRISRYGNETHTHSKFINLNPITIPLRDKKKDTIHCEHSYIYNDELFWENNNDFTKIV